MGIMVKIIGGGIGLASEAIHDYRNRSSSRSQKAPSPNPSTSRAIPSTLQDGPPKYVEVANEATAEHTIRSGQAERVVDYADEKKPSKASEAGFSDTSSSDGAEGGDEAAWELDEMASRVAPPPGPPPRFVRRGGGFGGGHREERRGCDSRAHPHGGPTTSADSEAAVCGDDPAAAAAE